MRGASKVSPGITMLSRERAEVAQGPADICETSEFTSRLRVLQTMRIPSSFKLLNRVIYV